MDRYPARAVEYQDRSLYTQLAAEAARRYLDDTGKIDYTLFGYDTLGALATSPGFVAEPAQVAPYHIGTTAEEFTKNSNNFHLLFDDFWGAGRREEPYYQRFIILFPEFAQALRAQHKEYGRRCVDLGPSFYRIEDEFAESLRTAYGIMAQLIDLNDMHYKDQRVRDVDPTTVLRA